MDSLSLMPFPYSFQSHKNAISCFLWPVSIVYLFLVKIRWLLYQQGLLKKRGFSTPVVVVGNVVVGGAGKTPLVLALTYHLQASELQVGIVSRGYARTTDSVLEVQVQTPASEAGDEPALLKRSTGVPVFVARNRSDGVAALLLAYPETAVVICDDGLQHYALARDIEIAVFDNRGAGNGWLLPAGLLREPWPERQARGVDLVLHTGNQPAFAGLKGQRQLAKNALDRDGTLVSLQTLKNQPLVALAGIANPDTFFTMLRILGLTLTNTFAFPDHFSFSSVDFSQWNGKTVLCTQKDAVKLFERADLKAIRFLSVELEFTPEPAFFTAFDALLKPLLCHLLLSHGHQTSSIAGLPCDQRHLNL